MLGPYWGYIGDILGMHWGYVAVIWGYMQIMEMKMETTTVFRCRGALWFGYLRVWDRV